MTALIFTTNGGSRGDDVLSVRASYDVEHDVLTVDNRILGRDGNDALQSVQLPLSPGGTPVSFTITVDGGAGNDGLTGFNASDLLFGGAGNDVLAGASGCILQGGAGTDTLQHNVSTTGPFGGNLRISYAAQAAGTATLADGSRISGFEVFNIVAGAGRDMLDLSGDAKANGSTFFGFGGNDTVTVDAATKGQISFDGENGNDRLVANLATATAAVELGSGVGGLSTAGLLVGCQNVEFYTVTTGSGDDKLFGGDRADVLKAGSGNDELGGGLGNDELTGGLGNDRFVFAALDEGVDSIADFENVAGDNDRLTFEFSDVGALGREADGRGAVRGIHFQASSAATAQTAEARFIYDTDDGKLRFDADGNGAGAAVVICVLPEVPSIAAQDIFIV